ncbi:hypothetical protein [Kitasatospora cineracea]|uniref:hypothetical protein n=1 Tax=Kitasatospora cineracea TaxID=88074 RepID=UPI0033EE28E3
MQLLLADPAARRAAAELASALEDGTLADAIEQSYDLSAEEAAEASAAVSRALVDTWGNRSHYLPYGQWLADIQPALLHVLVDAAARAVHNPWAGGEGLRVLSHALGYIARDHRLFA